MTRKFGRFGAPFDVYEDMLARIWVAQRQEQEDPTREKVSTSNTPDGVTSKPITNARPALSSLPKEVDPGVGPTTVCDRGAAARFSFRAWLNSVNSVEDAYLPSLQRYSFV